MAFIKRVFLFLVVNFLVITMISFFLNWLNIRPYLEQGGIQYQDLMIFCLIWGMGGAFISLWISRWIAKWSFGIKILSPQTKDPEALKLLQMVERLAQKAQVPTPEVGVYYSNEVNAFATGPTRNSSLVAISSGLLSRLKEEELEGVLGHEISHIANGDMVTMTLLQGVINAFVMFLARALAFAVSGLGRNEKSQAFSWATYMIFVFLFEIVFMVLGSLVIAFYSRYREYRADRGGATLAGKMAMIAALESLKAVQNLKDPRVEKPAFQAFKISHQAKHGLTALFATHPPLDQRIERLKQMA